MVFPALRRTPSKQEQARRFKERTTNPLKQYKLSPIDQHSQALWDKYTIAEYAMFMASHTDHAPWTVISADKKKRARLNAIRHILSQIDYPDKLKKESLKTDAGVVCDAEKVIADFNAKAALKN
jgi:hypothetical protein